VVSPQLDLSARPDFAVKAGRVLDLYARQWQGRALKDDEFVISADEKTSIQARCRKHATQTYRPRTPMHVEHEYFRRGAWTYIAGLDVHHARIFGRCESKNGIAPFDRLVEQVMTRPPYNDARRVFWIVDNCSVHHGAKAVERLRTLYPRLALVHAPIHASWLNQIEIYFSVVQRKVLTPKRLYRSQRPRRAPSRLSILLGNHNSALRMEVHPSGSYPTSRQARNPALIPAPQNTLVNF
jgi:DDE superfamily endonuclease